MGIRGGKKNKNTVTIYKLPTSKSLFFLFFTNLHGVVVIPN